MPIGQLRPDGNTPGLWVCERDWDGLDPYRLPPRAVETITLPFTRPEESVATHPFGLITEDGQNFIITQDGEEYLEP